ncbi:MAG: hypothetical protein GEV11_20145 [Streptosporangiales bacterium]|nr:hypothetical protein [Streptosporangiales bacterium]
MPASDGATRPSGPLPPPPSGRVVALGEALLRLTTPGQDRLEQAAGLYIGVGGAELNALIGLAQLGYATRFVTRLPDNPLGRRVAMHTSAFGVDVLADWEAGGRLGLYFVEPGVPPRPTEVHYDRAGSAAAGLAPGRIDWASALGDAICLHGTGITCALGADPEATVLEAYAAARERGVTTSFDVNHRSRLWTAEAAVAAYRRVLPLADVVFASPQDLALVLGREGEPEALAGGLRTEFGARVVVVKRNLAADAGRVAVAVTAVDGSGAVAGEAAVAEPVDPFGGGDASAAGFLAAHLAGAGLREAADIAARACAHMHTIPGDSWVVRPGELTAGADGRRILR